MEKVEKDFDLGDLDSSSLRGSSEGKLPGMISSSSFKANTVAASCNEN